MLSGHMRCATEWVGKASLGLEGGRARWSSETFISVGLGRRRKGFAPAGKNRQCFLDSRERDTSVHDVLNTTVS